MIAPACPDCGQVCAHPLERTDSEGNYVPPTDEQVAKAENRWTCRGSSFVVYVGGRRTAEKTCLGRTGVMADPETWAAWKKAMRVRRKETVVVGRHCIGYDRYDFIGPEPLDDGVTTMVGASLLPEMSRGCRGKWTFTVVFEPED